MSSPKRAGSGTANFVSQVPPRLSSLAWDKCSHGVGPEDRATSEMSYSPLRKYKTRLRELVEQFEESEDGVGESGDPVEVVVGVEMAADEAGGIS